VSNSPAPLVLAAHLAALSLISFGGIPVVLPQIHQPVVLANGWTTDREFADFLRCRRSCRGQISFSC
jgi:chromate transport protein ChrA